MMWYWHDNAGWAGWSLMLFSMLVFWGLLGWGIWAVLRVGPGTGAAERSPEQVLRHRFAAGEIDAEAYRQAQAVLAGRDGQVPQAR